jgi:capsular polysaccharide biosynthesis protein
LDQSEIDLRQLFQVLRRRLALLIAMPIVAGLVAGLVSAFVMDPVYSAKTTLWVIKDDTSQLSYNDVLLSRNLTKTYAEVAQSQAVLAEVARTLGNRYTVTQLQEKVSVTPVRDTEIIAFEVEDNDPALAAAIANALSEAFQQQIRTFMKVENVAVVDRATVPTDPIKPRTLMNVAVAVVLGGMAAVGIIFLLEYLDTSLKSPEEVTQHLGLPVLGQIPTIEIPEAEGAPAPAVSPARSRRRKRKGVFQA